MQGLMKNMLVKKFKLYLVILPLLFLLASCGFISRGYVKIIQDGPIELSIGSSFQLEYECSNDLKEKEFKWESNSDCIQVNENGLIFAKEIGTAVVTLKVDNYFDSVDVNVTNISISIPELQLNASKYDIYVEESVSLSCQMINFEEKDINNEEIVYQITSGEEYALLNNNILTGKSEGSVKVIATYNDVKSNEITINIHKKSVEEKLILSTSKSEIEIGEVIQFNCEMSSGNIETQGIVFEIIDGKNYASIDGNKLTGLSIGQVKVVAKKGDLISNIITITINDPSTLQKIELRASKYYLSSGEKALLIANKYPESATGNITYEIKKGSYYVTFFGTDQICAVATGGITTIVAKCGDIISNEIEITTVNGSGTPTSINLTSNKEICSVGDYVSLDYEVSPSSASKNIEFIINDGEDSAYIVGNKVYITNENPVCIVGKIGGVYSNEIYINDTSINEDPYLNISQYEFYSNYTPAKSYIDSYYRSLHGFMSGSIEPQRPEPTPSKYQPKENGLFLRNSFAKYSQDGNTYYVVDAYGNVVNEIYKGGGYVTLEEVAAYIFAFGEIPANYVEGKSEKPGNSIWGEYLRLNNSYFSGDTSRYPYEPVLPNIRGCGGDLYYYEVDIGTTGTDCDPRYPARNYNNGSSISRGAARIVYTRYDANKNKIIDINEKYLFYTYNHYNDFQEYLNYQGGWGEMFGNITGGGEISSSSNYNPTSYVQVIFKDFTSNSTEPTKLKKHCISPNLLRKKENLFEFC